MHIFLGQRLDNFFQPTRFLVNLKLVTFKSFYHNKKPISAHAYPEKLHAARPTFPLRAKVGAIKVFWPRKCRLLSAAPPGPAVTFRTNTHGGRRNNFVRRRAL
jgi:hypothetical protein